MKKTFLLATLTCMCTLAFGQEMNVRVKHFNKVIASPRVHLVLEKGREESVRVVYHDVSVEKINVSVSGKTLRIFLDGARKTDPVRKRGSRSEKVYGDAAVTAYVTFRDVEMLEVRGNQELVCHSPLESEKFVLRAYGENDIRLAGLKTEFFKAKLYGQNELSIEKGKVVEQKYLLYGENRIDTRALKSAYSITSIFGEGSLRLNSSEEVRVDAFGEPRIHVDGGAHVHRRLVIGKATISRN